MNNRMEQDHRGITQRYYPMRGFGSFTGAARFCSAHNEVRHYFRQRVKLNELIHLALLRPQFRTRLGELRALSVAV